MVKLKRINEGQLNLFDWKPKEIDPPKPTVSKEPDPYGGLTDTDQSKWFTQSFLNKKYDEYNRKFFNGRLSNIPVKTGRKASNTIGSCKFVGNLKSDSIEVLEISIMDYAYESRFYLENVLLHEMCHVYQIEQLCKKKLSVYKKDSRQGSGSSGHGPLFFEAANLVNNSANNTEGFKITQYEEGGHVVSKRDTSIKLDGWFFCDPSLYYVSLGCISNTTKGKQIMLDSSPLALYTYKDVEIKKKLQEGFGRKINMFGYDNKAVSDVINMIQEGNLIPVKETNRKVDLFIGKNKDSWKYQFVSTDNPDKKSLYDEVDDVEMNKPYSIIKNRIRNEEMTLFYGLAYRFLESAVSKGVYDMPEDLGNFIKSENKQVENIIKESSSTVEDIQKDINELEDIKNVLNIDQYSDGTFEITIC